jgi:hypothetical protein
MFILWDLIVVINDQRNNDKLLDLNTTKAYNDYYPFSLYNCTILNSNSIFIPKLFFFFIPFIVSIDAITIFKNYSYRNDKKDKWTNIISRSFFCGCISGLEIVIINFISFALFIPAVKPEVFSGYFTVLGQSYDSLYYHKPFIYTCLYSLIDIFYCGLFSMFFVALSRLFTYSFFKYCIPIAFSFLIEYFSYYNNIIRLFNPISFLRQCQFDYPFQFKIVMIEALMMIILTLVFNTVVNLYERNSHD